jgi:hypothetical protein
LYWQLTICETTRSFSPSPPCLEPWKTQFPSAPRYETPLSKVWISFCRSVVIPLLIRPALMMFTAE